MWKVLRFRKRVKSRIQRRVNLDNIRLRRMVYRSNYPELRFKNIIIDGANPQQQAYIKKEFHSSDNKEFTYEDLKEVPLLKRDTLLTTKYLDFFEKIIGFNLEKRIAVNGSIETMKNLLKQGLGFAILPYYSVYEEVEKGILKTIHSFEKSEDRFQIVLIRENEDKEGISKFVEFLKNYEIMSDIKK